jgi:hypothetical protein
MMPTKQSKPVSIQLNCGMKQWLLILVVLFSTDVSAQTDIGIGGAFESPFLISKAGGGYNHYTGVPALRLDVTTLSLGETFHPAATISIAPYILPVSKIGLTDRALLMEFFSVNAMFFAKIVKELPDEKQLLFGIGIGATYLQGTGVSFSGDYTSYTTINTDSAEYIKAVTPQVNLGLEIRRRIPSSKHVGVALGVNIIYSYYFQRNTSWRIDIVDNNYNYYKLNPSLGGHMINPAVYAMLYYRFDKSSR